MTDTPTIALYYREHDPMKRKMFLDQSIAAGGEEGGKAVPKDPYRQVKMRRQMLSVRNCGNCVTENLQRQAPVHVLMDIWHFGWQWNITRIQRESCLV